MVSSPQEALDGVKVAVIGHIAREDRPAFLAAYSGQSVIDLGFLPELKAAAGAAYQGLCW